MQGYEIVAVAGKDVRTKRQLAKVLQEAGSRAGSALNFVVRKLREEAVVPSSSAGLKARSLAQSDATTGSVALVSVALERHSKHGYGLDLSDDLVIKSVRSPAQVRTSSVSRNVVALFVYPLFAFWFGCLTGYLPLHKI